MTGAARPVQPIPAKSAGSGRGAVAAARAPVVYGKDPEAREVSTALFQRLDTDSNGFLSQTELLQARSVMLCHEDASHEAIMKLTSLSADVDKNSDHMIDEEEWHDFLCSLYEVMGRKQFLLIARNWTKVSPSPGHAAAAPAKDDAASNGGAKAGLQTPVHVDVSDAVLNAAATHIQSMHRGKKARANVEKQRYKAKSRSTASESTEQKLTTLAQIWELLATSGGRMQMSIEVRDIVRLFGQCKRTGVDLQLATSVPMHLTECGSPEDLSQGEVAHLCLMLIDRPDLTVHEARAALEPIKADCREDAANSTDSTAVDREFVLAYKHFKQLVPMLAALMRIDQQYLISQMQWVCTGRFEMPETLAAMLADQCARKGDRPAGSGPLPELAAVSPDDVWASLAAGAELDVQGLPDPGVLAKRLALEHFVRFCYNAGIVDASRKAGIGYTDMSALFTRTVSRLPELLRARAEKAKQAPAALAKGRADYLTGRTELEVLMEELSREPSMQRLHASPLRMVLWLLQRCRDPKLLDPAKQLEAIQQSLQDAKRGCSRSGSWK